MVLFIRLLKYLRYKKLVRNMYVQMIIVLSQSLNQTKNLKKFLTRRNEIKGKRFRKDPE